MGLLKFNTRFNPTANGPLHIGHIYTILVNEAEAHATGGKFIVRIEDDQENWVLQCGRDGTAEIVRGMIDDINWLGIHVDEWQLQSQMHDKRDEWINFLQPYDLRLQKRVFFDQQPELTYRDVYGTFPYAPYLTMEHVVYDAMSGINLVIRGDDLVSEYGLYAFFCEFFGTFRPRHVYIPRLQLPKSELLADISKTTGNHQVASFRERGMDPEELHAKLRASCLKDPDELWTLPNLLKEPIWLY